MYLGRILLSVFLISSSVIAQSPDAVKYAPRPVMLVSPESGVEAVMPMVFTNDGQQHLEFVPVSQIKISMDKGGLPVRMGDVLSALTESAETIGKLQDENARLKAENEKLWKVAMKDDPQPQPTTVVIQQPAAQQPSQLEKYILLRSLMQPAPKSTTQNLNVTVSDCTRLPALCAGK